MKIPILMYHSISDSGDYENLPSACRPYGYRIGIGAFEEHLGELKEGGWETIALKDLVLRKQIPPKAVVITFDDGYKDNYDTVLPRLLEYGFRAVFFISVAFIGKTGMMGLEELKYMLKAGMEIGSHGMNHDLLNGRNNSELYWELKESKRCLNEYLSTRTEFFSLPRGYLPSSFPRLAKQAGYQGLCTSYPGFNKDQADLFLLRRFPIRSGWGRAELHAILNGEGKLFRKLLLLECLRSFLRKRYRYFIFSLKK